MEILYDKLVFDPILSAVMACFGAGALLTPLVALSISAAAGLTGCLRYGAGGGRVLCTAFQLSVAAVGLAMAVPSVLHAATTGEWALPGGDLAGLGTIVFVVLVIWWLVAHTVRGLVKMLESGEAQGMFLDAGHATLELAGRLRERIQTRMFLKYQSVATLRMRRASLESRIRWLEAESADPRDANGRSGPFTKLRLRWTLVRKRRAAANLAAVRDALERAPDPEEDGDLLLDDDDHEDYYYECDEYDDEREASV